MTPCRMRACVALVALASGAAVSGCGPSDAKDLVPVAGRVTLDGGGWPKSGRLTFLPAGESSSHASAGGPRPTRPGFAEFGKDGRFVAQTRRPGDGLMPGRYRVGVSCWLEEPDVSREGNGPIAPESVRDATHSRLFVEIPARGTKNLVIEVRQ